MPIENYPIITISNPAENVEKARTEKLTPTAEDFNIRKASTHLEECLSDINYRQNNESNYKSDITSKNSIKSDDHQHAKISKDLDNF